MTQQSHEGNDHPAYPQQNQPVPQNGSEPFAENLQYFNKRRLEMLEDRVVREIFAAAGRSDELPDYRQETGEKTLRLNTFAKRFPTFPIRLAVPTQEAEMNFPAGLLWSSFAKNPLNAEYTTQFGKAPFSGQGYYGLVVSLERIGLFVVHNNFPRDRTGECETVFERPYGRRPTLIVNERFRPLIRGIRVDWWEG